MPRIVKEADVRRNEILEVVYLLLKGNDPSAKIQCTAAAYEKAITRVLGASSGDIQIAPVENFRQWFELTAHSSKLLSRRHAWQNL